MKKELPDNKHEHPPGFISIGPQSETSVVVSFGDTISESILQRISLLNDTLRQFPFYGFSETVAAYTTLTVYYDPLKVMSSATLTGSYAFQRVISYIKGLSLNGQTIMSSIPHRTVEIPVCYDPEFGPDQEEVGRHTGLSVQEIIRLHTNAFYTVYMIGFMPGFPYLGGMDIALSAPRKLIPRQDVPAGSVGIAGEQTGIYPLPSPGGWQLIGRTPLNLFDPYSDPPALLRAGDKIIFSSITSLEYTELKHR